MKTGDTISGDKEIKQTEHQGDLQTYLRICKERGYLPKFARFIYDNVEYNKTPNGISSVRMKVDPETGEPEASPTQVMAQQFQSDQADQDRASAEKIAAMKPEPAPPTEERPAPKKSSTAKALRKMRHPSRLRHLHGFLTAEKNAE
jgi:hypothetical protein